MFVKRIFLYFLLSSNLILAFQIKDTSILNLRKNWVKQGKQAYSRKDINTLKNYTKKIDSFYLKNQDSSFLAKYYHFKALENRLLYINDSTFYYYNKSKEISKLLNDSLNVGIRLSSIGTVQRKAKDFLGSEISYIQALKYIEPLNNYKYLERIYNRLGLVSKALKQKKSALKYFNKALEVNKINKNNSGWLHLMNNIGLLYQSEGEYKTSIKYLKKGLAFDSIQIKHPTNYTFLLENLTFSELALGNKENTLENYNKIITLRKKEKDYSNLGGSYCLLAQFYKTEGEIKKAMKNSYIALDYAEKTNNNERCLEALKLLSDLHRGKKALNYLNKYIQLNDSLFDSERRLKNQFAKIRYETEKKEKENTVLKIDNEKKEAEITSQKQQKTIGWLLFLASLLGLGFSVLFFVSRRRRLIYQNKLQKIQAREKERQLIAKSLHDEVAGDLRLLHQKLQKSQLLEEAEKLNLVKENVRSLSHKLSSVSFDKVSFKDQVVNLVSDYFEPNFRIQIKGINEHEWTNIDDVIKRSLYLCIRECIQNCKKYAKATKVILDFSVSKKNVFLNIIDNGIGFDTNKSKKGIGLKNLEERLEELNGTLTIESETDNGVKIHVQIPLNA